jgi:hypothetical protein
MTSHRKRRDGTRSWWIAVALTAVAAVAVVVAGWQLIPASPAAARPRPAPLAASASGAGAGALVNVLHLVNEGGMAKGLLPPSSCEPDAATTVTCMAPALGITGVVFSTYSSPGALLAAYVARVRSLNSGQFTADYSGCGPSEPTVAGEAGWSQQPSHPAPGTGTQAAKATGVRTAGRVFCTMTAGAQEDVVWTQDDGRLLGWVAGEPHQEVWAWWAAIHGSITFPG